MEKTDIIIYILLVTTLVICIYFEIKHHVCDGLKCLTYNHSKDISEGIERKLYINVIDGQTHQSVWMRSFICSFIVTCIAYALITRNIPRAIEFLCLQAMVFLIFYFSIAFYQHHFMKPLNESLKNYMERNCGM